ncbi:MAG TPA: PIN domain-containing protein [Thermoanaerobaculia bacterium]
MTTFLDTSAILALFDADDPRHPEVDSVWKELILSDEPLVSSNYILVETLALVQRRLGMAAVQAVYQDVIPLLEIEWLNEEIHERALAAFLKASRRRLSFVDCSSFEVMWQRGITRAFAVDGHFNEHGFEQIPAKAKET